MSRQAAHRIEAAAPDWPAAAPEAGRAAPRSGRERARRARLIRRRRTDLRQDVALAVIVALFTLIYTAGLGVVALLSIPVAAGLACSLVAERWLRRRRAQRRVDQPPARARTGASPQSCSSR
jgi:Flp pilus assembly protein TadB